MSEIGRNDPCPCGSGRKYKKCCLLKEAAAQGAFTKAERESALARVFRFADRPDLDQAHGLANEAFWDDWAEGRTEDELRDAMDLEQSTTAYLEWFVFDYTLPAGRTVAEEVLARERAELRSGEVRYLERMRLAHLRPYEVARVRPDEGLDLVDLWTRERVRVSERLATRQLVQWDLIAARVMLGPAGVPVLDGQPYLYPALAREEVMRRLRRAYRQYRRASPGGDIGGFFKRNAMLFHHLWLDHVAFRPVPAVLTAEGDEVVLARVVFDVKDRKVVETALADRPDLERQDDGSYVWLEAGEEFRRGLGTVALTGPRLVFEATSCPRAERGRALIEALAGDAVTYRATSYEDVAQAVKRARPAPRSSDIPPEVEAQVIGEFYEKHYRGWLDQPLPALDGQTPREAAKLKSARSKLISLLKAMENMSERGRREGRPEYDFGWMWAELGLERPG